MSETGTSWVVDLRKEPIEVPFEIYAWAVEHSGELRREGYKLAIVENELTNEPLVRLTDYGVVNSSYETEKYALVDAHRLIDKDLHLSQHVYVRGSVARKLILVDKRLRNDGMFLYVRSGYRHPRVQELAYQLATEKHGEEFAKSRYAVKEELVGSESVFPHSTGGVVDVEIWQEGKRMKMGAQGVPIHSWELEVLLNKKELPKEWKGYAMNRRILYHFMREEGFYPSGEYWHWGFGDHLSYMSAKMLGEESYRPWYGEAKFPD